MTVFTTQCLKESLDSSGSSYWRLTAGTEMGRWDGGVQFPGTCVRRQHLTPGAVGRFDLHVAQIYLNFMIVSEVKELCTSASGQRTRVWPS
mmetsp:Transcript_12552/g.38360  ORF Transcript_12552/g.38360 Transcript_12552/m.38360 type:complete len:91 (+) Transcript_12552:793-1065(+)